MWNKEALKPFGEAFGDKEVGALGEAHHTSGGFYRAKAALIKYLIEYENFRALAFEANWNKVFAINDYLSGITDDAKAALLSNGYRIWHDESVLNLLKWIRNYNDIHKNDQVTFFWF